jgi:DNA-directed RNA polymerase subunit RPC12/RpoP
VSEVHDEQGQFEAVCPHCRKEFVGELLAGPSAHQRGFKCPHCKLFVPHERSQQEDGTPATPS